MSSVRSASSAAKVALLSCLAVAGVEQASAQSQFTNFLMNANRNVSGATPSQFTSRALMQQQVNQAFNVGSFSPHALANQAQFAKSYFSSFSSNVSSTGPVVKPFSGANFGSPSVTPYLSLSSPFSSTATNYYTQVRPQIDQQRLIQQQQQQNIAVQRQLNSISARPPYDVAGSARIAPTGHSAVFDNTLGYYPQPQQQQRRR